jgi:hypothetical protein
VKRWELSSWTKYRQRMQHEHGWEVELRCPACGLLAHPVFRGWTPSHAVSFGNRPTIYARLDCPACGAGLKATAGEKLLELFADVPLPARNRRLMSWFVALHVGLPLAMVAVIAPGIRYRREAWALTVLMLLVLSSRSLGMWFNYQIASIRCRCQCGRPGYKFMGLLGRSYCYRCSSCGRRLRLKD